MSFYEDRVFPVLLKLGTRAFIPERQSLIAQAQGQVLELGVGNGENLAFYTDSAREIHAIEPSSALLAMAVEQAEKHGITDRFMPLCGSAEQLPYPDNYFDTVIACLVFCTIPDAELAAREMYRVLKPGGRVLILEHVKAPGFKGRLQHTLNPVWQVCACGCQLDRDTRAVFSRTGLDVTGAEHKEHPRASRLIRRILTGEASKPV